VLDAVGSIAAQLREALGDTATESGKLAASETFTAASLEAAQRYSRAQELSYSAKYEEAIAAYREALQQDPNLGRAYAGWAVAAAILGRTEEAEALYKQALARLDRMTEREKYRTLGTYYLRVARNPEKAIENFSLLVEKYPADASALNNLAVSHFNALNFAKALEYGKRLVSVYPEQVQWRYNFALYAMYAGDFENARVHAQEALKRNPDIPKAYLALAMAQIATGRVEDGVTWWNRAAASSVQGASLAAMGLADLALYTGRHADAEALLPAEIDKDRLARNTAGVAAKLIARAEARQLSGNRKETIALAKEALALNTAESIVVPAARVLLASGRRADALGIAAELGKRLNPRARAYGKVIESEAALQEGRTLEAVEAARAALKLADLWLVRYALGVAYVQAGAYAEALSELEACDKRRGEATSVFLNDVPSWRYMAPLTYWLGRAREGVGLKTQALENYRAYVALRPSTLKEPLAEDARRRIGS
jgi:tetratricopeptide (TPR) repeat protein